MRDNLFYYISLITFYLFQINNVNAFQEAGAPIVDPGVDSLYIYLSLEDLKEVEVKNNYFEASLWYEVSSNKNLSKDEEWVVARPQKGPIILNVRENIVNEIGDYQLSDTIAYSSLYSRFDHNWNLQDYPFDRQELKIRFSGSYDSSYLKLFPKQEKYFNIGKLEQLKQGFKVETITFSKSYDKVENDPIYTFNDKHEEVIESSYTIREVLDFNIILGREGSWLYLKLFIGAIAAFTISWMVFLISSNDFNSRIELSVGAIFGAIGNRTYVESIIPDVQILTKADMINNFVILMIVFNILLIIIQRNNAITWKVFENNRNAALYSLYLLLSIIIFILLWPAKLYGLQFIIYSFLIALLGYFIINGDLKSNCQSKSS